MPVRPLSRWVAVMATAVVVEAHAADQNADLQYSRFAASVESPRKTFLFWERFDVAFHDRADDVFADQLHPLTVMKWNVELANHDSGDLRDRAAGRARYALTKSVIYSGREAAVDI